MPGYERVNPLGCLVLALVLSPQAYCCMCFSTPLCSRQQAPGDKTAIFVGTVVELNPSFDAIRDSVFASGGRPTLPRAKAELLRLWRGLLFAEEVLRIESADSLGQLVADTSFLSHRVRFHVGEWLEGGSGGSFELFTEESSCGYRFAVGKRYMVVAFRNGNAERWRTGACSRTAPVEDVFAQEDIRALRAVRDGRPLPPHVYGKIYDGRESVGSASGVPNALLRLVGESSSRETRSDAQGWYAFDDLPAGRYQLELREPAAQGKPAAVDLTSYRCFQASGLVKGNGAFSTYEILGEMGLVAPSPAGIVVEEPDLPIPPAVPSQRPPAFDWFPPALFPVPLKNK